MARKKTDTPKGKELSQRQQEIAAIRAVPKDQRDASQRDLLARLVQEERRDRFLRLYVKRVRGARKALANVTRLANTVSYDYTPEEGGKIVEVLSEDMAALKRAFTGAVKEKGLFDV